MGSRKAELVLTSLDNPGFVNSSTGDLNLYVTDTNQGIHIGTNTNNNASIVLRGGTTTINTHVAVNGNLQTSNLNVSGTISRDNQPLLTTQWTTSETSNAIHLMGSNVGVGTQNPTSRLHVIGDVVSSGTVTACNINFTGQLQVNGQQLQTTQWQTTPTKSGLFIGAGSNVGINTSNPQFPLDVAGNINSVGTVFASNLDFKGALTRNGVPLVTNQWRNNTASNVVFLGTGSNLAIGKSTYNSNVVLDVAGSVNVDGSITLSNVLFTGNLLKNGSAIVSSAWSNTSFNVWTSNVAVGVNTSNPQYDLDVSGKFRATDDIFAACNIRLTGNLIRNGVAFQSSQWSNAIGIGGVYMVPGQTVGIGVATPTTALDVAGNAKVSGTMTATTMSNTTSSSSNIVTNIANIGVAIVPTLSNQNLSSSNITTSAINATQAVISVINASQLSASNATITTQLRTSNVVTNNLTTSTASVSNLTISNTFVSPLATVNGLTASNIMASNAVIPIMSNTSISTSNIFASQSMTTPSGSVYNLNSFNASFSNVTLNGNLNAQGTASSITINAMVNQVIDSQTIVAFTSTIPTFSVQTASVFNNVSQTTENRTVAYVASVPTSILLTPSQWVTSRSGSDTFSYQVHVFDTSNNLISKTTSSGIIPVSFTVLTGQSWSVVVNQVISPTGTTLLNGTSFTVVYTPLAQLTAAIANIATSFVASNATINNYRGSSVVASNISINTLSASNAVIQTLSNNALSTSNLVASNIIATNTTLQTMTASNVATSNLSVIQFTVQNIACSNANVNLLDAKTATFSNVNLSNAVAQSFTASNVMASNVQIGTLNASSIVTSSDVTIGGNLAVNGTLTTVNTQTVQLSNNIIEINAGQTGIPSLNLQSGIMVERGSLSNYYFVYAESNETFRVGTIGNLQPVATREDIIQHATIPWWDSNNSRYSHTENVVVTSDGRLGVGVYNPTETLHVQSNARIENTLFTKDVRLSGKLYINGVPYVNTGSQFVSGAGFVYIGMNSNGSSSNLGVGTSNPLYPIDVVGSVNATDTIYAPTMSNVTTSTSNLVVGVSMQAPIATVTNMNVSALSASTNVNAPMATLTTLSNTNISSSNIVSRLISGCNVSFSNATVAVNLTTSNFSTPNATITELTSSNITTSNIISGLAAFTTVNVMNLTSKTTIGSNINLYGDNSFASTTSTIYIHPVDGQSGTLDDAILMNTSITSFTSSNSVVNTLTGISKYTATLPTNVTVQATSWSTSRITPDLNVQYVVKTFDVNGVLMGTVSLTGLQSTTFPLYALQSFSLVRNEVAAYTINSTSTIGVTLTTLKPDALMVNGTATITSNLVATNARIPTLTSTLASVSVLSNAVLASSNAFINGVLTCSNVVASNISASNCAIKNVSASNIGIGTVAGSNALDINGNMTVSSNVSITGNLQMKTSVSMKGIILERPSGTFANVNTQSQWATGPASSIYLTGSNVLIGNNAYVSGASGVLQVTGCNGVSPISTFVNTTNDQSAIEFLNANGIVGSIKTSGTTVAYLTSSDYRMKENVQPLANALSMLKQLRPTSYTFRSDPEHIPQQGFLAHELASVLPQAVYGAKDGKVMQSVDYSRLTPLLTAAIQELLNRIEALENV